MAGWEDEDATPTIREPSPRRLHARHLMFAGMPLIAIGAITYAAGGLAVGPMLVVLGVVIMTLGAFGWIFEKLGAWDDDPGTGPESIRLTDVARMPTRIRRH